MAGECFTTEPFWSRTPTLADLAAKYGTDKLQHRYIPYYEQHLPKNPARILEIGCLTGASLRMWREYLPDTEIHCLDLFEEHQPPEDIPGVIYWKGSQTNQYVLEQLRRIYFDVIIDDGSHNSRDQLIAFWSLWGCCDLYVVEDLHCALDEPYRQGLPMQNTFLRQLTDCDHTYGFGGGNRFDIYDNKIAFIYAS
jgi:hypothetical protein